MAVDYANDQSADAKGGKAAQVSTTVNGDENAYRPDVHFENKGISGARIEGRDPERSHPAGSEDSIAGYSNFDGGRPLSKEQTIALTRALVDNVRAKTWDAPGYATLETVVTGQDGFARADIGDSHFLLVGDNGNVVKLNTPHENQNMSSGKMQHPITNAVGKKTPPNGDNISYMSYEDAANLVGTRNFKIVMTSDGTSDRPGDPNEKMVVDKDGIPDRKKYQEMSRLEDEAFLKTVVKQAGGTDPQRLIAAAIKNGSGDDISVVTVDPTPGHFAALSDGAGGMGGGAPTSRMAIAAIDEKMYEEMRARGVRPVDRPVGAFNAESPELTAPLASPAQAPADRARGAAASQNALENSRRSAIIGRTVQQNTEAVTFENGRANIDLAKVTDRQLAADLMSVGNQDGRGHVILDKEGTDFAAKIKQNQFSALERVANRYPESLSVDGRGAASVDVTKVRDPELVQDLRAFGAKNEQNKVTFGESHSSALGAMTQKKMQPTADQARSPSPQQGQAPDAFSYMQKEIMGTLPSNKTYKFEPTGTGFIALTQHGIDKHITTGWKFHLSCAPEDVPKAWNIVTDEIAKDGPNHRAKVANPETIREFSDPSVSGNQAGKFITIYADKDVGPEREKALMERINARLKENGVKPFIDVEGDRKVPGSDYLSYRNDKTLNGSGYEAGKDRIKLSPDRAYNPHNFPDPYADLRIGGDSAGRGQARPSARASMEDQAREGGWHRLPEQQQHSRLAVLDNEAVATHDVQQTLDRTARVLQDQVGGHTGELPLAHELTGRTGGLFSKENIGRMGEATHGVNGAIGTIASGASLFKDLNDGTLQNDLQTGGVAAALGYANINADAANTFFGGSSMLGRAATYLKGAGLIAEDGNLAGTLAKLGNFGKAAEKAGGPVAFIAAGVQTVNDAMHGKGHEAMNDAGSFGGGILGGMGGAAAGGGVFSAITEPLGAMGGGWAGGKVADGIGGDWAQEQLDKHADVIRGIMGQQNNAAQMATTLGYGDEAQKALKVLNSGDKPNQDDIQNVISSVQNKGAPSSGDLAATASKVKDQLPPGALDQVAAIMDQHPAHKHVKGSARHVADGQQDLAKLATPENLALAHTMLGKLGGLQ